MNTEQLFERIRQRLGATAEERALKVQRMQNRLEAERVARETCAECKVDTGRYSHTFKCRYRGAF